MVVFSNCKINLGLQILQKRVDGYHNIATVFYPIPLYDVIEIIPAAETNLFTTGLTVSGNTEDNLCLKAYRLLQKDFALPPVHIHLHKTIPMGAGLGGGSANGAFVLRLLNDKLNLTISKEQLIAYALQLGSDCPFFILNQPCYATGRGELLTPIPLDLKGYKLLLINPGIHINTGWAFGQLQPAQPAIALDALITAPITKWRHTLINDFEKAVFAAHPVIAHIKATLYQQGALYATMSGSGSTVIGIFERHVATNMVSEALTMTYFVKEILL